MTGAFSGATSLHRLSRTTLEYDDRLQIEEPPHFLNPIEADWFIQRETLVQRNP